MRDAVVHNRPSTHRTDARRPTTDARARIGRKRIIHTRFHRRHRRRASFTREARRPRDTVFARQPQGFRTDPPHRPVVRRPRERVKRRRRRRDARSITAVTVRSRFVVTRRVVRTIAIDSLRR